MRAPLKEVVLISCDAFYWLHEIYEKHFGTSRLILLKTIVLGLISVIPFTVSIQAFDECFAGSFEVIVGYSTSSTV